MLTPWTFFSVKKLWLVSKDYSFSQRESITPRAEWTLIDYNGALIMVFIHRTLSDLVHFRQFYGEMTSLHSCFALQNRETDMIRWFIHSLEIQCFENYWDIRKTSEMYLLKLMRTGLIYIFPQYVLEKTKWTKWQSNNSC